MKCKNCGRNIRFTGRYWTHESYYSCKYEDIYMTTHKPPDSLLDRGDLEATPFTKEENIQRLLTKLNEANSD